jgi:hypothetical protein
MPPLKGLGSDVKAPVNARYRITAPYGLNIDGWPYACGDELEPTSPLRKMPERMRQLVSQRKIEMIVEED